MELNDYHNTLSSGSIYAEDPNWSIARQCVNAFDRSTILVKNCIWSDKVLNKR